MEALTDDKFQKSVILAKGVVVVDFWATWCQPCKALAPILLGVEKKHPKVKFFKVDVMKNPVAGESYKIQSVPTILIFKNGTVKKQIIGLVKADVIEKALESLK